MTAPNTKIILPVNQFVLPSGLVLNGRNIQYRPQDDNGNLIGFNFRMDDPTNLTNKSVAFIKDSANGNTVLGAGTLQVAGIGLLATSLYVYQGIRVPYSPVINGLNQFTIRLKKQSYSNSARTIIHESMYEAGFERIVVNQSATEISVLTYNAAGTSTSSTTTGLGLVNDTTYEIQVTYDGNHADGACLVTLSVGGVQKTISNASTHKLLKSIVQDDQITWIIGGAASDNGTTGWTWGAGARSTFAEIIFYPNVILPATYTPAVTQFLPFTASQPEDYINIDSGRSDTIWDPALLDAVDLTNFTAGNLKVRAVYSATPSPALSGTPALLSAFQGGAKVRARYARLGRTWQGTDGLTQITAPDMYWGVEPAGYLRRG